jgi:hypothetical protein
VVESISATCEGLLRSMMVPPSGGVEAVTWLVPASPFTDKGVTPSVRPYNRPRSLDLITIVKCAWCRGDGSISLYDGSTVVVLVPVLLSVSLVSLSPPS